jgi:hypothetical protein
MFEVNINKNNSLEALQQLVEQNFSKNLNYLPDSFNQKQQEAYELFKSRIFLEKTIDEAISFNRSLNFPSENKNLHLTTTAEDLIEVFKLRSDVYRSINYQNEFPDTIEGLNFDKYDSNSAILFYKKEKMLTGTTRLIFDSNNNLPSEKNLSFNRFRLENKIIGELSRLIVRKETSKLSLEFKNIMQAIYLLFINNEIDITFLAIIKNHYNLYDRFGGSEIVYSFDTYGDLGHPVYILSWDPSKVSPFFKRAFLNQK